MKTDAAENIGMPGRNGPKPGDIFQKIEAELATCDEYITPDCLRALYEFPVNEIKASGNSYEIVEYTPQAYPASDLDMFFLCQLLTETQEEDFDYDGELDLDLEYGMALVYPQQVTLYQVGDITGEESFNTFLDALDASYCTFEGGDDPIEDSHYPVASYSYQGPNECGGNVNAKNMPNSVSLATVLYSSGDDGVAGNSDQCIEPITREYNNGSYGIFNPSFPGTCPYITSVRSTQIVPGASVTSPEEASETVIYSDGGFSNVFPIPSSQEEAVHTWWTEHPPPYSADRFNNSQKTRGFPDVSANGANYIVAVDGEFYLVYGTSCSFSRLRGRSSH
ncbi:putative aorsin precursor [Phaeomoniella chlamydospora]|uniref:Putative aorsin n=1 Tax=Phaeomoniella chlamydospora TaxID=158046 RepID=A0A0G2F148_PHACM|nr:putative aorsin precursor [Phaeomoniella chlamydospora]